MTDDLVTRAREVLGWITQGKPVQYHPTYCKEAVGAPFKEWDTSHDLSIVRPDGERLRIGTFRHADDAAFDQVARELVPAMADRIEALEADNARLRHAALIREERIAELERHFQEAVSEVSQAGRKQGEAEGALVAAQVKMSEAMTAIAMASNRLDWCVDTSETLAEIEDAKQSAEASVVRKWNAFVTRDMPKDGEG